MLRIDAPHNKPIKNYGFTLMNSVSWHPGGKYVWCSKWFATPPGFPTRRLLIKPSGRVIRRLGDAQTDPVYSHGAEPARILAMASCAAWALASGRPLPFMRIEKVSAWRLALVT